MNIELSSRPSTAGNPFVALMSPELVIAAHERMANRVAGVVHRPLDKPRLVRAGQEALAALDAEVDVEMSDEVDNAFDSSGSFPDTMSETDRRFI